MRSNARRSSTHKRTSQPCSATNAGRRFDGILLLIILASLVIVMLDSIDEVHQNYADVLACLRYGLSLSTRKMRSMRMMRMINRYCASL